MIKSSGVLGIAPEVYLLFVLALEFQTLQKSSVLPSLVRH
jgi:hypothetical protein